MGKNLLKNAQRMILIMNNEDIYNDGTYIQNNPSLHSEDALYKFTYIQDLLQTYLSSNSKNEISILDIGGGCGKIGRFVCEFFQKQNIKISFTALDLSLEMLDIQRENNPHINQSLNTPLESLEEHYDLILLIDVIEHISDYLSFTNLLKQKTSYIIFNIPIEKNFFDFAKNIYFKGQYYKWQEQTLGHLHFFSYCGAKKYLRKNFQILKYTYPQYAQHVLTTESLEYNEQRKNKLRLLELKISAWIARNLKNIAPYIVQGSLFALVKTKS